MTKKVKLDENIEIGLDCNSSNKNINYFGNNINKEIEITYEEIELKRKNKIQINSNQVPTTTINLYRNSNYEINDTSTTLFKKKSFINKMVEIETQSQISPRSQPLQPQQSIAIQFSKLFI